MSGRALCVFLRAPELGRVKTRLAATHGETQALRLYEAFVEDVVGSAAEAARRSGASLELAVAGRLNLPSVTALAERHAATIVAQSSGNLGARMRAVIDRHLGEGRAACVLGSDAPHLTGAQIARAFEGLVVHDVVLGPSRDGGYWLIGARRAVPALFEGVSWSTPSVLQATLERLAGTSTALLEMSFDVDDGEDLALLRRWLGVLPPEVAPATRAALALSN